LLAYTLGAISPKRTKTKVTRTTVIRNLSQSGILSGSIAMKMKLAESTMPMFTKLLAIRIVESR
jgi:hypothetical protein